MIRRLIPHFASDSIRSIKSDLASTMRVSNPRLCLRGSCEESKHCDRYKRGYPRLSQRTKPPSANRQHSDENSGAEQGGKKQNRVLADQDCRQTKKRAAIDAEAATIAIIRDFRCFVPSRCS
jgi:hypothetical protein